MIPREYAKASGKYRETFGDAKFEGEISDEEIILSRVLGWNQEPLAER
jgi:hypothetical protein